MGAVVVAGWGSGLDPVSDLAVVSLSDVAGADPSSVLRASAAMSRAGFASGGDTFGPAGSEPAGLAAGAVDSAMRFSSAGLLGPTGAMRTPGSAAAVADPGVGPAEATGSGLAGDAGGAEVAGRAASDDVF